MGLRSDHFPGNDMNPYQREHPTDICKIRTRVLNISLRPKWFTRTARNALAIRNQVYRDCIHLPSGSCYRNILLARSRVDSIGNLNKAMLERNITTHVKDNKMSLYAYIKLNAHPSLHFLFPIISRCLWTFVTMYWTLASFLATDRRTR